MRTLVVHTGAIGDFLLACPALAELARDAAVELAGNRARLELAVAAGIARTAHDLDAIEFHTVFSQPSAKLRKFIRPFDRIIVWMRDPDGSLRRGLETCSARRVDVFPGLPDAHWSRHASEYYAECLGLSELPPLRLAIAPAGTPLDVVIHPGSGSPTKNWPLENFREVADAFVAQGRRVTWCAGPAEEERGGLSPLHDDDLRGLSLVELARRLGTARLYLGNDSGITHLAAALGVPTLAVFGPTDPRIWGPRGRRVRILQGDPWPSAGDVLDAALGFD
jgi:ADP-heptose:LPS heptosyltransferase